MEILLVLLLIVFVIIHVSSSNAYNRTLEALQKKIDRLLYETEQIRGSIKDLSQGANNIPVAEVPVEPESIPETEVEPLIAPVEVEHFSYSQAFFPTREEEETEIPVLQPEAAPVLPQESWWEKWMRNNPDLEKFIGENLINKIGIAVLVLGIAFFVKYAIDQNWINETGRVCIGIFCGAVLVGLAHYLRNSYRSFSSVLAGGGIAVFYFTIAFAFHQYHLLPQMAAFIIMVIITAFAIALSVLYNKIELAVIAAVGGFLTPFMISTGEGNYVILFTYLIILNAGLLALAFFKRWLLINILALFFTELIFGGWLVKVNVYDAKVSYPLALLFASLLYLLFLSMNMVHQVKNKQAFRPLDYSVLLLLNGSYFAAGILLLQNVNEGQFQGIFTLGIGLINLVLARYLFKRQQTDRNLLYLLIGLTLTFLSLTIPIQLEGHAITLFWSMEFVLLFWLYQRSQIRMFYFSSLLVMVLTVISILMDWSKAGDDVSSSLVLIYSNLRGLVTNIVVAASFGTYAWLLNKQSDTLPEPISKKQLQQTLVLGTVVITYLTAIYGINLLCRHFTNYDVPNVYHRLVTQLAVAGVLIWQQKIKANKYTWPFTSAVCLYLLYHLFSTSSILHLRDGVLIGNYASIHLLFHWISVGGILYLVYKAVQLMRILPSPYISASRVSWIFSTLLLVLFSLETQHLFVVFQYSPGSIDHVESQYAKAVLTIVWALCSFGLMWLGMRYKNKTLRIISLSVFCMALLKLFFYDIANVSEGGKIAAFILLGILLLTISFMYQKLKKMIIDDVKE